MYSKDGRTFYVSDEIFSQLWTDHLANTQYGLGEQYKLANGGEQFDPWTYEYVVSHYVIQDGNITIEQIVGEHDVDDYSYFSYTRRSIDGVEISRGWNESEGGFFMDVYDFMNMLTYTHEYSIDMFFATEKSVNKVELSDGTIIMDITDTTATEETVAQGEIFYKANGDRAVGTMSGGGSSTPTLQEKTISPTESPQDVVPDSGYDGLSKVTVSAISRTYVGSGVPKQAGRTITPSTSSQTAIATNTYATGTITVAPIHVETKTVNSNGTVTPTSGAYLASVVVDIPIQHYYTGSTTPANTLGEDGDIYLKA